MSHDQEGARYKVHIDAAEAHLAAAEASDAFGQEEALISIGYALLAIVDQLRGMRQDLSPIPDRS